MKKNPRLTYKIIIGIIILFIVMIAASMVSMVILVRDMQAISGYTDEKYERHFAFIHQGEDSGFWDSVYQGAKQAGEYRNVYVEDFGANLIVDYSAEELVDIAIAANVDGIILEGNGSELNDILIGKASSRGIPVVTVSRDNSSSKRVSFVGVSSYTMGRQYGEEMLKIIGDNGLRVVVMMDADRTDGSQELALSGITDVLAERGYGERIEIEGIYIDNTAMFNAEENIRDIFLREDFPDAIVAMNSVYTRCLFQAAVDFNKVGEVHIYGFNDSSDILDAVSKKILDATLTIDTTAMGRESVEALQEYMDTGYVSEYIALDSEMIQPGEAIRILQDRDEDNK